MGDDRWVVVRILAASMLLNRVEYVLMNNPVRALIQRHVEARRLLRMGGPMSGGSALEIGCGRGVGLGLVLDMFGADTADGFDLDPTMVARARKHVAHRSEQMRLWVGDAARIPSRSAAYDAVFDFGVIHHVPRWRDAIAEVARVLKPGGRLYGEEVLARFILHPLIKRLFDHPMHDRFNAQELRAALEKAGLVVEGWMPLSEWFVWFVAVKPAAEVGPVISRGS